MKIKRATAVYTGGNIYCYYAEMIDSNWIMGSDDGLLIVNQNPLSEELNPESGIFDSDYIEWQTAHLVKYINDDEFWLYLKLILEAIFQGKTIKEYNNFQIEELKQRYNS